MPTAVVIDGAFFLRRFHVSFPDLDRTDAGQVAAAVVGMAAFHVAAGQGWSPVSAARAAAQQQVESVELFRIFFYDCPPLTKRVHSPISNRAINLGLTDEARLRSAIHARLHGSRKVALRLGRLNDKLTPWRVKPGAVDRWTTEGFQPGDSDFELDIIQKGVDMRLGLDVASMAFKRQVQRIVLIAADADFVPAVKLARR